jgi:arylsulfatase A-like enzyme
MNRSSFLLLALLAAGCLNEEPREPPNFLFIVTDDQRYDMLGVVNPVLHTPNMDRLAGEGVRFENAFVTTPICAASRASLLTGMVERSHQYTFGTPPLSKDLTDRSYARVLREAGYHTGFVGKFGVNTEPGAVDSMFHAFVPLRPAPYIKTLEDGSTRHLTDITADESISYLRSSRGPGPFALTVSFNAPHADDGDERQFIWPQAMDSLYADLSIPSPPLSDPAFFEALPEFQREASLNRIRWFWRFDTPDKAANMTRGHLRMISGVDAAIGRIRDELESLGLADNTIIVLMGDNGYFLGERGYAGKWTPHELSIRVPLIVYDPVEGLRGATPSAPVLNIDIAPTLLDLAGIDAPQGMQGQSLAPLLKGTTPAEWREDFFVEHLFNHPDIPKHEGVRGERFKFARYFEQDPVYEELYDLLEDPVEAHNLAPDPAYASVLDSLRKRTDEVRDLYGGPYAARVRVP